MRKQQTPSYSVLLMKHKLVSPRATAIDCWAVWQRVCEDPVVRERSMKRAKKHRPNQLPSVHAGYTYAAPILNAMTAAELAALRDRLGVRPVKEFAVL